MIETGSVHTVVFNADTGSSVTVVPVTPLNVALPGVTVTESPPDSGEFPYTRVYDITGTWTLRFSANGVIETLFVRSDIPVTPIATVDDFEELTGVHLTGVQRDRVSALLQAISSDVRNYTGKPYPDSDVEPWLRAAVVEAAVELGALSDNPVDPRVAAYSVAEVSTTYRTNTGTYGYLTQGLRSRLPRRVTSVQTLEEESEGGNPIWVPVWVSNPPWGW